MSVFKVYLEYDQIGGVKARLKIDTGEFDPEFPFESLHLETSPPETGKCQLHLTLNNEANADPDRKMARPKFWGWFGGREKPVKRGSENH